jgi:DNA-binding transcriptional regulator YdaS (Cro superfamily)
MSTLSQFIKSDPGKSIADWAVRFGISRPYLYGLMDGTRTPSPEVAIQIERETAGVIPAASWPNIAAMLTAADAVRGAAQ